MHCRPATPDDAPLLAAMNHRLIRDEGHRNPMNIEQLTDRMADWLTGEYEATVIEHDGADIGYALFRREPEHVYLRQFYIEPTHRRQGLGRSAMRWLRDNAWQDSQRIRLDVLTHNDRAIAFWRSVGFVDYCVTMEWE